MKFFHSLILAVCLGAFFHAPVEGAKLTITTTGNVSGAVGVMGSGSNVCNPNPGGSGGGTCTFDYAPGTVLRMAANSPNIPGVFSGGTGATSSCITSTCNFTIGNIDSTITATFSTFAPRLHIDIALGGVGKGEVLTDNSKCQNFELNYSACTVYYAPGSEVIFDGQSVPGNIFMNYSGGTLNAAACGAASRCVFMLDANTAVTVSFAALTSVAVQPHAVTIPVGQTPGFNAMATFTNGATRFVNGQLGSWSTRSSMPGPPPSVSGGGVRFGLGAGVVGNFLYAVGGGPSVCVTSPCTGGPLATVEVYDTAVASGFGSFDSWTTKSSMLTPRESLAVAVVSGKVYAMGGHTTGGASVATMEVYDPSIDTWALKAPMSAPRSAFAAAVIGNVIYAIGGNSADGGLPWAPLNRLEAYDSVSNTWTTKAPMPAGSGGVAAAAVNGKLYAIGVDSGNTVQEYNPITNTWTMKSPMPSPGGYVAAGVVDGLIYVVGGPAGIVRVYNPATDTWATLAPMPTARGEFALGVLDGRLFVVGGLVGSGPFVALATNEAFRPPELTWWSSNTAIATINHIGTATGLSLGTSTISARSVGIDSAGQSAALTVAGSAGGGPATRLDVDGDAKSENTVFRPSNGTWYVRLSAQGTVNTFQWGLPGDLPVSGDFDGDGKIELTVFRPSNGSWYIRYSAQSYDIASYQSFQWGLPGDVPVAGDFDGDGKTDVTVFRPSNGTWYIRYSSQSYAAPYGTYQWGLPGDVPLIVDFDGDGKSELAVFRPFNGTWYIRYSAQNYDVNFWIGYQWGLPGDTPIAGDFDGDAKTDLGIWRPSNGTWYIRYSILAYNTVDAFQWGLPGDVPIAADFDGDTRTDLTIWRPSNGTWYVRYSAQSYNPATAGTIQWGLSGDGPVK